MTENDLVLNGRYKLSRRITMPGLVSSELWEGTDQDDELHTLRLNEFKGEKPSPEIRRIWDNDLRVMYRLSSSAGADEQLVVMKDAGIDIAAHATILVYEGWNYLSFAQIIEGRDQLDWLSFRRLKEPGVRRELWRALLKLAGGLQLLHEQNLIHRNVSPEAIWGREDEGPESLRLSGFDWSARLGHVAGTSASNAWSTPPELEHVGYSFASDWYGFGTTVARCFYSVEHLGTRPPKDLAETLAATIPRENRCQLYELEKSFIRTLIAPDRFDRQQRSSAILSGIENIVEALDLGVQAKKGRRSVLLYVDCKSPKMIEAMQDSGFVVNPSDPFDAFDPNSPDHRTRLKDFLSSHLRRSSLAWKRDRNQLEISCGSLFIRCEKWMDNSTKEQSWTAAKASRINRVSRMPEPVPANGFSDARIEVEFGPREVYSKIGSNADYTSWESFAPREEVVRRLGRDSEHLQQFLHASNQFEALVCDAELFKYKMVHHREKNGFSQVTITQVAEDRPSRRFFNAGEKLTDFLQQELDSGKKDTDKVLLTPSDSLFVSRAGSSMFSERFDVNNEQWRVDEIDHDNEVVSLSRRKLPTVDVAPAEGYLRTRGHYGQIRLIQRRKGSIDRLASHAYLLRAMATPNLTRIDAGESTLPLRHIERENVIDGNKIAIIKDVLRLRPIYALQGPPGTGKSTLVAHLLRQILDDDPMAQILVTAKDHDAVDALRAMVTREAYKDAAQGRLPIAVRLSRRDGHDHAAELVKDLARDALDVLLDCPPPVGNESHRDIQERWTRVLEGLRDYIKIRDVSEQSDTNADESPAIFVSLKDLIHQGASITYCTTSSGDLEELAKGSRSFDWSIVEEAGKTHGFDLALPLQAGHRWLLLGDHKQLRPFLYDEFVDCFDRLEEAVGVLEELSRKRGNDRLIDIEWIKTRLDADANADTWARSFKAFGRTWLGSFATIFEKLTKGTGIEEITQTEPIGAMAGRLAMQYRMPPVVGDLISSVFYNNEICNGTATAAGEPREDHCNPFVDPPWLAGQSLVWLDTPWTVEYGSFRETGYSNRGELKAIVRLAQTAAIAADAQPQEPYTVAILTPYNMQKTKINTDMNLAAPVGCQFVSSPDRDADNIRAYSVDSFQGNEADIVVVSLVRNELPKGGRQPTPSDIEFIAQPDRLNVMLSRSVRLLVIVGCWDYLSACVAGVSSATDEQGEFVDRKYGPFKKTLETLESLFAERRAVRVSVKEI